MSMLLTGPTILALLLAGGPATGAPQAAAAASPTIGKPVRVVSLCFKTATLDRVAAIVDDEATKGADLICLPEAWRGNDVVEPLSGPTITTFSRLARQHHTYVVCPIYQQKAGHRLNSSVLIDRTGAVAAVYDKIFPYWNEFDLVPPADPGQEDAVVYDADFGRVGLATCYDAKFPEVFQRLRDKGAELVVWASAYSGFTELQAFALLHHYYIVTSTLTGDSLAYDIDGALLRDQRGPGDVTVSRFTLDMDRTIYHYNFNLDKRARLLAEHPGEVALDADLPREEWFVLKAVRPGVSARQLGREYGLEELRTYKDRSRTGIDTRRGFSFADRYGGYPGRKSPAPAP
ncbi:MAG TPA: carbon-nitrogen hydrolase family protein [Vicinamibacteria bacterium]|nr:carbon-nitrogen hydrolase family protein [Vicinamibacteria bacterium]